jgi:glycine/D-amino acid oxidase-like deaminating enzyme
MSEEKDKLVNTVDVIIIGAGVSGLSTAYHLNSISKKQISILILEGSFVFS